VGWDFSKYYLLYIGGFLWVEWSRENDAYIYMMCFQTLSFMGTWVLYDYIVCANCFMCVVLGENGVFRIFYPLV
jgi:hypothetical protein